MTRNQFIEKYCVGNEYSVIEMHLALDTVILWETKWSESKRTEPINPCCPYEDRANGSRCNNCGDPPKNSVKTYPVHPNDAKP